ncbi:MAG: hypothetical protein M3Q42_00685 [Pseudomonadota bacterium]|nr:hypothetical protein [Pseudomonadota bacterium]
MLSSRKTIGPLARVFALAGFLLMLGGCATGGYLPGAGTGYPGQGGYPGQQYPDQQYPDNTGQSITGTVEVVDLRSQRLMLLTQPAYGSRGAQVEVYFDRNTPLYYQGRQVAMEGLERGDVVRVQTGQSSGRLFARSVEVVHNVRDGQQYGGGQYGDQYGGQYGDQYGNELRGTVGHVDSRSRMIEIERGGYGGERVRLRYDDRTLVEYQGRRYNPRDLDPGDMVRIQTRRTGNELLAERIFVERSARTR